MSQPPSSIAVRVSVVLGVYTVVEVGESAVAVSSTSTGDSYRYQKGSELIESILKVAMAGKMGGSLRYENAEKLTFSWDKRLPTKFISV